MFGACQAVAAAQAGSTLISPFPGRVLEWTKADNPKGPQRFEPNEDPGVVACRRERERERERRAVGGMWMDGTGVYQSSVECGMPSSYVCPA